MHLVHYGVLHDPLRDADLNPGDKYPGRYIELHGEKPRIPYVLWTSPIDSKWGWKDWCKAEGFGDLSYEVHLKLSEQARLFTIDGPDDLMYLVNRYPGPVEAWRSPYQRTNIDWVRFAGDFDAVHLTEQGNYTLHLPIDGPLPFGIDLNSWDCESVAIFRAAQYCKVLTKKPHNETAG